VLSHQSVRREVSSSRKTTNPEVWYTPFRSLTTWKFSTSQGWEGVGRLMADSAIRLSRAGAEFVVCRTTRYIQAFDPGRVAFSDSWLHIADAIRKRRSIASIAASRSLTRLVDGRSSLCRQVRRGGDSIGHSG